jgi:hypothetical protein
VVRNDEAADQVWHFLSFCNYLLTIFLIWLNCGDHALRSYSISNTFKNSLIIHEQLSNLE